MISTDYQEELTDTALQLLALLLNYHPLAPKSNQVMSNILNFFKIDSKNPAKYFYWLY